MSVTRRVRILLLPKAVFLGCLALVGSLAAGQPARDQASASEREQPAGDRLTVAEFDRLHAKLTKMSTEKVWSIPWQLSVREARELAAKENKPVFLWISSNGGTHPLGPC